MKNFLAIILILSYIMKIITVDVLEFGETKESSLGYIIFNSANQKEGANIKFKIKAHSFIKNEIRYYYFDDLEKFDTANINTNVLYYKNFTNDIASKENEFEVNNFIINKSSTEYANIEGKYLIIFYYTNDSYAEITSVKEEDEEEKGFDKRYLLLLLLLLLVLVYLYYDCNKRRKKKQIEELERKNKAQIEVLKNKGMQINMGNKKYVVASNEKKILEDNLNRLETERRQLKLAEEEKRKKEEKEKEMLANYINKVKEKFPNVVDMIVMVEEKVNIEDLISLNIQSGDQVIQCIVICKKTEILNSVINKVFEKNPEFKEYSNFLLSNGVKLKEYQSLEENNIKDGAAIALYKMDDMDDEQ